jgi:hypothetical protein
MPLTFARASDDLIHGSGLYSRGWLACYRNTEAVERGGTARVVDAETNPMKIYVTSEAFAKKANASTFAQSSYPDYF